MLNSKVILVKLRNSLGILGFKFSIGFPLAYSKNSNILCRKPYLCGPHLPYIASLFSLNLHRDHPVLLLVPPTLNVVSNLFAFSQPDLFCLLELFNPLLSLSSNQVLIYKTQLPPSHMSTNFPKIPFKKCCLNTEGVFLCISSV